MGVPPCQNIEEEEEKRGVLCGRDEISQHVHRSGGLTIGAEYTLGSQKGYLSLAEVESGTLVEGRYTDLYGGKEVVGC